MKERGLPFSQIGILALRFSPFIDEARFPFAEQSRQLVADLVDRGVEVAIRLAGVDVRASDGQVNLHTKISAGCGLLVMHQDDVRSEDLAGDFFEALNFLRDVGVDSTGEADVAGAEMDLHGWCCVG